MRVFSSAPPNTQPSQEVSKRKPWPPVILLSGCRERWNILALLPSFFCQLRVREQLSQQGPFPAPSCLLKQSRLRKQRGLAVLLAWPARSRKLDPKVHAVSPPSAPICKEMGWCGQDWKRASDNTEVVYLEGYKEKKGLPRWPSGKESTCQCRRLWFDPWVGKISWKRKWEEPWRGQKVL